MSNCFIYLRNVPRHIKEQFKAVCARRGENMTESIVNFMKQTVDEENKELLDYINSERRRGDK